MNAVWDSAASLRKRGTAESHRFSSKNVRLVFSSLFVQQLCVAFPVQPSGVEWAVSVADEPILNWPARVSAAHRGRRGHRTAQWISSRSDSAGRCLRGLCRGQSNRPTRCFSRSRSTSTRNPSRLVFTPGTRSGTNQVMPASPASRHSPQDQRTAIPATVTA